MENSNLPAVITHPYRIVHALKQRIRVVVPKLVKDQEKHYILAILLRKHSGVQEVRSVPEIGSIVIRFDPQNLSQAKLLSLLDNLIHNLGNAKPLAVSAYGLKDKGRCPVREFNLSIEGMTCPSCALLMEVRLKRDPRIEAVTINFATETATVLAGMDKEDLVNQIGVMGYKAHAADTLTQRRLLAVREKERLEQARSRAIWGNLLNLPAITLAIVGATTPGMRWFEFATTIPIALWSGRPFFSKAWRLFSQHRTANMDTLIALGLGLGYSNGLFTLLARRRTQFFQAGLAVISFVLIGRYLEEKAKGKAHAAIRQLLDRQPNTATVLLEGRELTVDIDEIQVGDLLLVRPGERIPTDGEVIWGISAVNESMVTGESFNVIKNPGDRVIGGCINAGGALQVRATAVGADTVLAGIIQSVDLAQSGKLPIQRRVDGLAQRFMPAVLALSGATFLGWLAVGVAPELALNNAIAVLLIACPCALGLATPTAIMVGTGESARRGIFIRRGESLEEIAKLNVIVFDKTGTITEGKGRVTDIHNEIQWPERKILALAAAAEHSSEHLLGQALVAEAKERGIYIPVADDFAYEPGLGISAEVDGHGVLLGNLAWMLANHIQVKPLQDEAVVLAEAGKTCVYLAVDGKPAALFGIADRARANSKRAVTHLHRLGLKTLMLTGDTAQAARRIADEVGIDQVIAEAGPARKLEVIRQLQAEGFRVGMIGDGINDAPALAAADVGFAVATGADLAIDTADMSLSQGDLAKVVEAMALGKATLQVVRENLVWALGYNAVGLPLAALGRVNPLTASIAMSLSSLGLVLNALRLQRK